MDDYFEDEDLRQFYYRKPRMRRQSVFGEFTKFLLIACVACFVLSAMIGFDMNFMELVIFNSDNALSYPWIFVTNAFFHAGISHLFVNLWAIFMFGSFLELKRGSKFMVKLFFSSVIIANIVFGLFNPGVPGLGISGFVYAIIGSVVVFEPETRIFILPFPVPLKISVVGPIFLLISIVFAFTVSDGIAHIAHAAGFIVGYALSMYYKKKSIY
ncbi:MAG: rhomboid family intramembrane serine protease [Candidatus Nanoarchaeia archaeon]|nr:rhomboid family intramembrane serine protease [Candidatus Nanoarchaeia archaeon]